MSNIPVNQTEAVHLLRTSQVTAGRDLVTRRAELYSFVLVTPSNRLGRPKDIHKGFKHSLYVRRLFSISLNIRV